MDVKDITKKALEQQGSVYRLAKTLNVQWKTVNDWKTGKRMPQGNNLLKLLEIAGKSLAVVLLVSCLFAANSVPSYAANHTHAEKYLNRSQVFDSIVYYVK